MNEPKTTLADVHASMSNLGALLEKERQPGGLLASCARLTPEQQAQAGIACILSYIDGSITRVCCNCGDIFHRAAAEDEHLLCAACRPEQPRTCCDSPQYQTTRTREAEDGTEFTDRICVNCGARKQVES